MLGKRTVTQVVSLEDLAQFIKQVAPPQCHQPPQTTITIYIGELHIHQEPNAQLPSGYGRMALPEPGSVAWPDPQEDAGMSLDYLDRALGALAIKSR